MRYYYIILFIFLYSCSTLKNTAADAEIIESSASSNIIFLNFKIQKRSDDSFDIKLLNKTIVEGTLKQKSNRKNPSLGDIKCVQLSSKSISIDSIYISNPLFKTVEYVNDSGQLEQKKISLDSAEFTVRMQLRPESKFIATYRLGDPKNHLTKSKI